MRYGSAGLYRTPRSRRFAGLRISELRSAYHILMRHGAVDLHGRPKRSRRFAELRSACYIGARTIGARTIGARYCSACYILSEAVRGALCE
jgi:hypothetical protein